MKACPESRTGRADPALCVKAARAGFHFFGTEVRDQICSKNSGGSRRGLRYI